MKPASAAQPPVDGTIAALAPRLTHWYDESRRDLPWRKTRDPYAIWVSEMMLQQTQVATVIDYYRRWMKRFPTLHDLATADEDDVLHAWQGLGYYSRAKNLLKGARTVVRDHGGRLPRDVAALRALPGIGPYTAGAIASIAYRMPAAIVDGNVTRVLCRVHGLYGDPTRAPLKHTLWELAQTWASSDAPDRVNQALMELGATRCTPKKPVCSACPLSADCHAHARGVVDALPQSPKRPETTPVAMAAALVEASGRWLVLRLPHDARRWANMWQFPNVELHAGESAAQAAERAVFEAAQLRVQAGARLARVVHAVTRYRITLDAHDCALACDPAISPGAQPNLTWASPTELRQLAMPAAHRRLANVLSDGRLGDGQTEGRARRSATKTGRAPRGAIR